MTEAEFQAILGDASKRIEGDIAWSDDEDHSPAVEFRANILSDNGYPLVLWVKSGPCWINGIGAR